MKAMIFIALTACSTSRADSCRVLATKHSADTVELQRQAKTGTVKFSLLLDIEIDAMVLERCFHDL